METWHDDDTFWEVMAPFMFDPQRWANTPAEVDLILPLLAVEPGAALLDLGCGPGRHSLELARRGYRVAGVDRTASYLEQAGAQAAREGLEIDFVHQDMRHFHRPDAFDGALNMFTSFGYFEDPAENRQVLVNICNALKASGSLIMSMMGKEVLARIFQPRDWLEHEGAFRLEDRRVSNDWSRMENRWILLRGQERFEYQVSHWLYSAAELRAMLTDSGFRSVEVYGDLEGSPYDQAAKQLVAVARK